MYAIRSYYAQDLTALAVYLQEVADKAVEGYGPHDGGTDAHTIIV